MQIIVEGPRVNWKLLSLLNEDRQKEDADLPQLLNAGSYWFVCCTWSFMHRLQVYWLENRWFLESIVVLVHDSQQEERDFTAVTGSTVFPLKFCATRWVEDEKVAQRAVEIWQNFEQYIAHLLKETKSKYETSASFTTVQKATKDPLLVAELEVFVYIAKILRAFLLECQTDASMIMFLGEDPQDTCQKLMQKFVKMLSLDSADTAYKVAHLDVLDTKNHRSASDIHTRFATKAVLTNLVKKKAVSERGNLEFKMECVKFCQILQGFGQKSLKYKLVRSLFCLNPKRRLKFQKSAARHLKLY